MYIHGIKVHNLKYPPNVLAVYRHNTPDPYYAFHCAGIFDAGLVRSLTLRYVL